MHRNELLILRPNEGDEAIALPVEVLEKEVRSLDKAQLQSVFDLIQAAYAHVGGHGNVDSPYALYQYEDVLLADTDGDGLPNVAILAARMRNGSKKVGIFATDGSPAAKQVLMSKAKEVLSRPDWWAELPRQFASFLKSRGVPMVEDQGTAIMLLGRRVNPGEFKWLGSVAKSSGEGYYERRYFGSEPDVRAILGNVTPELIQKIQSFIMSKMQANARRNTRRTSRRTRARSTRKTSKSGGKKSQRKGEPKGYQFGVPPPVVGGQVYRGRWTLVGSRRLGIPKSTSDIDYMVPLENVWNHIAEFRPYSEVEGAYWKLVPGSDPEATVVALPGWAYDIIDGSYAQATQKYSPRRMRSLRNKVGKDNFYRAIGVAYTDETLRTYAKTSKRRKTSRRK